MEYLVALWSAIMETAGTIYAALTYHRGRAMGLRNSLPLKRLLRGMIVLTLIAWGAVAFDYYDRHYSSPDFEGGPRIIKRFGEVVYHEGAPRLFVVADGRPLKQFEADYRLAVLCFRTDGAADPIDSATLQKSALYDIRNHDMQLLVPVGRAFVEGWGTRGINYYPVLVPKEVTMDQFTTIRQARAMGVIQLLGAATLPGGGYATVGKDK